MIPSRIDRATKPRLLHVDDNRQLRASFGRVLAKYFYITQAADGCEAIALLKHLSLDAFDAVLTDLEMPVVGGDGLVEWLAQNNPLLAKRTIIITGGASAGRESWLNSFDATRVLCKPCPLDEVIGRIGQVLVCGSAL